MSKFRVGILCLLVLSMVSLGWAQEQRAADQQLISVKEDGTFDKTGLEVPPIKKAHLKIGFSPNAMNTQYDMVISGCKEAISKLPDPSSVDFVIQAPTNHSDTAEQMDIIESWIQQKYDVIAVCSVNDMAMYPVYRMAAAAGIPIFHFNTPSSSLVDPFFVSTVTCNQVMAGQAIGEAFVKRYGKKDTNIVVIEGLVGTPHNTERINGFKKAIADVNNFHIIDMQAADWVRDKAQTVMEDLLTKYGKKINVVWGMYDEMALGAVSAIKSRGLTKQIEVWGYDNTEDSYNSILRGEMFGTVDTASKQSGRDLINSIVKYCMKGEMIPKQVYVPPVVYTRDNIKTFNTSEYK